MKLLIYYSVLDFNKQDSDAEKKTDMYLQLCINYKPNNQYKSYNDTNYTIDKCV